MQEKYINIKFIKKKSIENPDVTAVNYYSAEWKDCWVMSIAYCL